MNLPRDPAKHTPGTWSYSQNSAAMPSVGCVTLWCPSCREPMTLHKWKWLWPVNAEVLPVLESESGHTIAPDGTVSPSVDCPHCACPYHESGVRLDGWRGIPCTTY